MEMVMHDNRRQLSAKVCLKSRSPCFVISVPFMSKEICATIDLSMGLQQDSPFLMIIKWLFQIILSSYALLILVYA